MFGSFSLLGWSALLVFKELPEETPNYWFSPSANFTSHRTVNRYLAAIIIKTANVYLKIFILCKVTDCFLVILLLEINNYKNNIIINKSG